MINQKAKEKKSDAQGVAEFAKLEDGVYRVFARKEGFAPALFEFALLKGSSESVTLNLVAGADKKLYFEDPAEEQRVRRSFLQQGLECCQTEQAMKTRRSSSSRRLKSIPPERRRSITIGAVFLQQGKFDKAVETLSRPPKLRIR